MKASMAIKPLVFAIAAVMAVAVQAADPQPNPKDTTDAGATAKAWDTQTSTGNSILNQGTKNKAEINNSVKGASGNVGVNVAAGDGNQQDNAAAIASGDGSFVFGTASATSSVKQFGNNNLVDNFSSTSSADMSGSANGGSGNMGINMAAGDLNQQKNTMAIAVSGGKHADASATADQQSPGLEVNNKADRTFRKDTLSSTNSSSGHSSSSNSSSLHVEKHVDKRFEKDVDKKVTVKADVKVDVDAAKTVTKDDGRHERRSVTFDASIKAKVDASVEKSFDKKVHEKVDNSFDKSREFSETSSFDLSNTVSWQVLTPTGWANPVTNTATLSGSVNGSSGNLGVNVAAGVGNQQSNSLSIAAGCKTCL